MLSSTYLAKPTFYIGILYSFNLNYMQHQIVVYDTYCFEINIKSIFKNAIYNFSDLNMSNVIRVTTIENEQLTHGSHLYLLTILHVILLAQNLYADK